jgi:enamine deaminase RidA (YjgF/YER057c/UK114 family)
MTAQRIRALESPSDRKALSMFDFAAMNAVYEKIFGPHPPARTTIEAARLPKDSLAEIDVIALE